MGPALLLTSKLFFAVAGLGAGMRLAQMARREGGLPVHTWASLIILVGGLGLVGFGAAPRLSASHPGVARILMLACDGLERVALLMLSLFIWRVFGAGSRLRLGLLVLVVVAQLAQWVWLLEHQQWPAPALPEIVEQTSHLVFALPLLWSTAEVFAEYRRARRQLVLGLCDPMVTNRYLLWTICCACFGGICLLAAHRVVIVPGSPAAQVNPAIQSMLYAVCTSVVLLGFYPPARYVRWVVGGA